MGIHESRHYAPGPLPVVSVGKGGRFLCQVFWSTQVSSNALACCQPKRAGILCLKKAFMNPSSGLYNNCSVSSVKVTPSEKKVLFAVIIVMLLK